MIGAEHGFQSRRGVGDPALFSVQFCDHYARIGVVSVAAAMARSRQACASCSSPLRNQGNSIKSPPFI
jgi:hypothetical protein